MIYKDMFEIPETTSDLEVTYSYLRILECYKAALNSVSNQPCLCRDIIQKKYEIIKSKQGEINEINNVEQKAIVDYDMDFFEAINELQRNSGHEGCHNAADRLARFLTDNPSSIMGKALLDAIYEQFEE